MNDNFEYYNNKNGTHMSETNSQPPIYLINLDKCTERLNNCTSRLNEQNLTLTRLSAVFGYDLSEAEKQKHYSTSLNQEQYHHALSDCEIGCYLSHRKAWEKIASGDAPYGIVLEDDIKLVGDLNLAIDTLNNLPIDWDVIKLSAYKDRQRKEAFSFKVSHEFNLTVHTKPMTGCAASAITKEAAKKLLQSSESFGRPVDVDIQHFWETGVNVLSLLPYPVAQDLSYQSTIADRKVEKSGRFWQRKRQQLTSYFLNKKAVAQQVANLKKALNQIRS